MSSHDWKKIPRLILRSLVANRSLKQARRRKWKIFILAKQKILETILPLRASP